MKKLVLALLVLTVPSLVFAQRKVRGYTRQDGKQVAPYERSPSNAYKWDNNNYKPSQPAYNPSYYNPTKNYAPAHYQPNANRFNDTNPYNNFAPAVPVQPTYQAPNYGF